MVCSSRVLARAPFALSRRGTIRTSRRWETKSAWRNPSAWPIRMSVSASSTSKKRSRRCSHASTSGDMVQERPVPTPVDPPPVHERLRELLTPVCLFRRCWLDNTSGRTAACSSAETTCALVPHRSSLEPGTCLPWAVARGLFDGHCRRRCGDIEGDPHRRVSLPDDRDTASAPHVSKYPLDVPRESVGPSHRPQPRKCHPVGFVQRGVASG